jgi:hypothetical protein
MEGDTPDTKSKGGATAAGERRIAFVGGIRKNRDDSPGAVNQITDAIKGGATMVEEVANVGLETHDPGVTGVRIDRPEETKP